MVGCLLLLLLLLLLAAGGWCNNYYCLLAGGLVVVVGCGCMLLWCYDDPPVFWQCFLVFSTSECVSRLPQQNMLLSLMWLLLPAHYYMNPFYASLR
jgi:hypothetical protein